MTRLPQTALASREPGALQPPSLVHSMELRVELGVALELGEVSRGWRRIVPIVGGTFEGPQVRGVVLAGGADWQTVRADGAWEIHTRCTLQAEDGDLISVQNPGVRHAPPTIARRLLAGKPVDPSHVYFRTTPTFETSARKLQWLTRAIFIGVGERHPSHVVVNVWMVR